MMSCKMTLCTGQWMSPNYSESDIKLWKHRVYCLVHPNICATENPMMTHVNSTKQKHVDAIEHLNR